jgi:hypothetical protein
MPFINKKQAFELLDGMMAGTCVKACRQGWLRRLKYALETPANPLKLTAAERRRMTAKIGEVKAHKRGMGAGATTQQTRKVDKKYLTRDSPPFPANEHCGETKKGNDGKMYTSVPNKNKVCRWVLK